VTTWAVINIGTEGQADRRLVYHKVTSPEAVSLYNRRYVLLVVDIVLRRVIVEFFDLDVTLSFIDRLSR